jgi:N utilization substance protein A
MTVVKSEFFLALNQVATERGISPQDVVDSIKVAVMAAYLKDYGKKHGVDEAQLEEGKEPESNLEVKINQDSGEMHIFEDEKDITPPGFGRIAAQTARQVILQQIREAEKRHIVQHYTGQVGTIIRGRVIRFEGRFVSFDIGKAEGILPVEEQIRNEQYRLNDTLTVYIKEIKEDHFGNSRIILSRSHPNLVNELFAKEVPEIASGTVKIYRVVREPGDRTKIAVHSDQQGVDPVGACVGQKGIRVKSVTDELGGNEKIDIIQYNEDDETFIREALSPATVEAIKLDKKNKRAEITVTEEQAPLAIGKGGVNVNLASKLVDYELDIKQIEGEKKAEEAEKPVEDEKVEVETEVEAPASAQTDTEPESETESA